MKLQKILCLDFIEEEVTDKWPPKVGINYSNRSLGNEKWRHFKLTELEDNKMFTLRSTEGNFSVKYTFNPLSKNSTKFEYIEAVEKGELETPFTSLQLEKLKSVMEKG